jgi:hypothetical protein
MTKGKTISFNKRGYKSIKNKSLNRHEMTKRDYSIYPYPIHTVYIKTKQKYFRIPSESNAMNQKQLESETILPIRFMIRLKKGNQLGSIFVVANDMCKLLRLKKHLAATRVIFSDEETVRSRVVATPSECGRSHIVTSGTPPHYAPQAFVSNQILTLLSPRGMNKLIESHSNKPEPVHSLVNNWYHKKLIDISKQKNHLFNATKNHARKLKNPTTSDDYLNELNNLKPDIDIDFSNKLMKHGAKNQKEMVIDDDVLSEEQEQEQEQESIQSDEEEIKSSDSPVIRTHHFSHETGRCNHLIRFFSVYNNSEEQPHFQTYIEPSNLAFGGLIKDRSIFDIESGHIIQLKIPSPFSDQMVREVQVLSCSSLIHLISLERKLTNDFFVEWAERVILPILKDPAALFLSQLNHHNY